MDKNLYVQYKRDTGKEPLQEMNVLEVEEDDIGILQGKNIIFVDDLNSISTAEDEEVFYTLAYIEWLEEKVKNFDLL